MFNKKGELSLLERHELDNMREEEIKSLLKEIEGYGIAYGFLCDRRTKKDRIPRTAILQFQIGGEYVGQITYLGHRELLKELQKELDLLRR